MRHISLSSLFLTLVLVLGACKPVSPTLQPAQRSTTLLPATTMPVPTSTLLPTITETASPTPTVTARLPTAARLFPSKTPTPTPLDTLAPAEIQATIQPLLSDPMNCAVPCFWGIIPGKTHFDEVKALFSRLELSPFTGSVSGRRFYTIEYLPGGEYDFSVTIYPKNNLVESIVVKPRIAKQEGAGPRKWIAYSPETLIKRYGNPVRVEFGLDWGPNFVIVMILYFEPADMIVYYSGYNMIPGRPRSPRLCPLTAPFDHVRLWMGDNAPNRPPESITLEKATSLTPDQFSQLMLGDPSQACFIINGNVFQ